MALNHKQKAFIEYYLIYWNATEAAKLAGYSEKTARQQGSRLLSNVYILQEIEARLNELKMGADEVIKRLSDMARGDIGDFMDIESMTAVINLNKAKQAHKTHLIKKVKQKTTYTTQKDGTETEDHYIELELHDPQAALVHLGKYLKLFTDRVEVVDWRSELIELISEGKVTYSELSNELGDGLTQELFRTAGKEIVMLDDEQ